MNLWKGLFLVSTLLILTSASPALADPISIQFSGVFSEIPVFKDGAPGNPVLFGPGSILEIAPGAVYVLVAGSGWQFIPTQLYPLMHANLFSGTGLYDPVLQSLLSFQMDVGGQAFTDSDIQPIRLSTEDLEFGFFGEVISKAANPSITQVPEPPTIALLTSALTAFGFCIYFKRSVQAKRLGTNSFLLPVEIRPWRKK